jgi:hypothetical protein
VKILCLFVRHGTTSYPDALAVLDRWYENHGLIDQRTLWIIDNALDASRPPEALSQDTILRPGDNQAWEFSAWEQALHQAVAENVPFDIVHFVTSAFNTLYTDYLNHFHRDMLNYTITWNIALGHIDFYPQPVQLGNTLSQVWLRTCFFFLPGSVARGLTPWIAYEDPMRFFAAADSRQFRSDAPLDASYQSFISSWLEGQVIGGHSWHSPVRSGGDEIIRFQRKTLAILNEHGLAITLQKSGIRLVDFCWLLSQREAPLSTGAEPPPELDQVRIRCRILGFQNVP